MPKVSVIVVNYNGRALTTDCLRFLARQTFRDFEVLVVDNGSLDSYSLSEIQDVLKEMPTGPNFKLISLRQNTGFAGGNLEGLKHARGEFVALLNNDTKPDPEWLEEIVKAMDAHKEVGICASKMITNGGHTIDSAGDGYANSLKGFKRGEGQNTRSFDRYEYVFGACAGAALYRRRMIDDIGFLDDEFFLIHEDTDMNYRAQITGWKVLYVPSAVVYHQVRATIGNMSDTAIYYTLRNSELVRLKNVTLQVFLKCLPGFLTGIVTEFVYFVLVQKKFRVYVRAKRDVLRAVPKMLKKRAIIMKKRKVDGPYLLGIMTTVWRVKFIRAKLKRFFHR